MEPLDYWRLCDELTVVQAAVLIVGEDPSAWGPENMPRGYAAAASALMNAIERKRLPAHIVDICDNFDRPVGGIDWDSTTISVEDVRAWLRSRGFKTGFFFPAPEGDPDYLSEFHPNYSPKLAAAPNSCHENDAAEHARQKARVSHGPNELHKRSLSPPERQRVRRFIEAKLRVAGRAGPRESPTHRIARPRPWGGRGGAQTGGAIRSPYPRRPKRLYGLPCYPRRYL
jgi:hypothetical protein